MHGLSAGEEPFVPVERDLNWPAFLAEKDLMWKELPRTWKEAPFLGNGELGTMIYQTDPHTLRWEVGCSAAHDHRPFEEDDLKEKNVTVLNRGRHSIGHLELRAKEALTRGTARLVLWDAEAQGTLTARLADSEIDAGAATWRSVVHAEEPILYAEVTGRGVLQDLEFSYVPASATNPRAIRAKIPRKPANPPAARSELPDGVKTAVHHLHAGGQTAVAWKQVKSGKTVKIWLSVQHSYPGKEATTKAVAAVQSAVKADQEKWLNAHRAWWHGYYPQSFLSTGDPFWDSFYWVQQYKLASATRDRGWIIDNQGPWLQPTAWNALWWNLNVQLSHSGFLTANRRGMGTALSHGLGVHRENLTLNVAPEYRADSSAIGRNTSGWDLLGYAGQPGGGRPPIDKKIGLECGNLLWALHNVDLEYRYWQDRALRDETLYPLLTRAVNYFRHFLVEEADGFLHLPKTFSPEYRMAEDCSYDLDLLRWGNNRLLELAKEKNLTAESEPLIPKWEAIQKKLIPTHTDDTGFMIGRDVPLTSGHRHWSHLLAIYPLRTVTPEEPAERALILRSLNHWHGFKKGGLGYSVTGGSCMASLLGDGERSLHFLNRLKSFLLPNTFYVELGALPVIETPLHGATAIQEMLLQSWGGRLRVFPAVPNAWPEVQFDQLRGEGAFLVSARREKGQTAWVHILAEGGGTVEVEMHLTDAQFSASHKEVRIQNKGEGLYEVTAPRGGEVVFWPKGEEQPTLQVNPTTLRGAPHRFGQP